MRVVTTGIPKAFAKARNSFAASRVNQRALRLRQLREKFLGLLLLHATRGEVFLPFAVAAQAQRPCALILPHPILHVLGHVDDHRTGATRGSDFKRGAHRGFQFLGFFHEENVFRAGRHDVENRRFLEGVGADGGAGHLARNHNQRD
jgi:hypothetical protein